MIGRFDDWSRRAFEIVALRDLHPVALKGRSILPLEWFFESFLSDMFRGLPLHWLARLM